MKRLMRTTLAVLGVGLLISACERPPVDTVQRGYRGTGMELVVNPRTAAALQAVNVAPVAPEPASPDGPRARDIYQNVQVLGDLSIAEFTRHMASITEWVSPEQGCNYCHNPQNLADDSVYTKVVARRMIQMTQHINGNWQAHVGATGVTCYTCHRGNPVPAEVWFQPLGQDKKADFIGNRNQQNEPLPRVALSSLPNDPFTPYLLGEEEIRVNATQALPATHVASIQDTERTFGLMVHFSKSLGVNCTYCHNTRSLGSWEGAPPTLGTAWHGIRMVRDLNNDFLVPLTDQFPGHRLGPTGDVAKTNCATCHQGLYKPLYGAEMAKDFPELLQIANISAGLPPPMVDAMRSVLFFGAGSAALQGDQASGLGQLVQAMAANPSTRASISGFHSASGEREVNEALARQRAEAVKASLLAAGVPEERLVLDRPQETEANVVGEDPVARRVEVTLQ
jgi:photosynthetic reaction center cytochrome c subunit